MRTPLRVAAAAFALALLPATLATAVLAQADPGKGHGQAKGHDKGQGQAKGHDKGAGKAKAKGQGTGKTKGKATSKAKGQAQAGAVSPKAWTWTRVDVQTKQDFRGLAAVDKRTAWVAGSEGGVWLTTDAGKTWAEVGPGSKWMFRDVEAKSATEALVLAIGEGKDSAVFRTTDAGKTWKQTFVNPEPKAFYDCLAMFPNGRDGLAVSDPVDGQLRLIRTSDGGATWAQVPTAGLPTPVEGEYFFAASGSCLITSGGNDAYLVSGGGAARVFHSADRGKTWTVESSPLAPGEAAGVFSIASQSKTHAILVGGDYEKETDGVARGAYLTKAGWVSSDLGGYRSAVTFVQGSKVAIAVGPSGSDLTKDGGRTWTAMGTDGFDAVSCAKGGCWASGHAGAVARLGK